MLNNFAFSVIRNRTKTLVALTAIGFMAAIALSAATAFAASTKKVTPGNSQGWMFNPDPRYATPYNFTEDKASIGNGSLYVQPIPATAPQKFITLKTLNIRATQYNSLSYDFLIAGNGDAADANQFYLNVYANIDNSDNFYDCRFDYTPTIGSTTEFTTATFSSASAPAAVAKRGTRIPACPATLAGMPRGSYVRAIVLNVGDTSASDTGLAGYLDKAVINTAAGSTTYNFELVNTPKQKRDCNNNGWRDYTDSQGRPFAGENDCKRFVKHQNHHRNHRPHRGHHEGDEHRSHHHHNGNRQHHEDKNEDN